MSGAIRAKGTSFCTGNCKACFAISVLTGNLGFLMLLDNVAMEDLCKSKSIAHSLTKQPRPFSLNIHPSSNKRL